MQYDALRTMLTRYRSLAADVSLRALPAPAAAVHPGEPYAELDVLVSSARDVRRSPNGNASLPLFLRPTREPSWKA